MPKTIEVLQPPLEEGPPITRQKVTGMRKGIQKRLN